VWVVFSFAYLVQLAINDSVDTDIVCACVYSTSVHQQFCVCCVALMSLAMMQVFLHEYLMLDAL